MKRLFAFLFLTISLMGIPEQARSETIYALPNTNQIFSFDSATPASISMSCCTKSMPMGASAWKRSRSSRCRARRC